MNCLRGRKQEIVIVHRRRFVLPVLLLACGTALSQTQTQARPGAASLQQLQRAVTLAEHGERQQALEIAAALLQSNPDFIPALKLRGALLEEAGRESEASQDYERALRLAPRDPGLLFKLGVYQLAAGQNGRAVDLLLRHVAIQPQDGDAFFYLAQAYHLGGQEDLALKAIRESVRIQPANAQFLQKYGELLYASGDNDEALRWLMKAQQADAGLDRIDFDISLAHYNNMDFADAAGSAAKAAQHAPTDPHALALLAASEMKLSRYAEAQHAFERILALNQDDVNALVGLGHCDVELKEFRESADTLERALQIDPTRLEAHYYLSQAYTGLGRAADAQHQTDLHHMMEQMSLAPAPLGSEGNKEVWHQAAQLLASHHEEEALRLFSQDPHVSPAEAHVFVGSIYLSSGDAKDGLRNFERAWEIDPAVRGAHTYAGEIALQENDLETAGTQFQAELGNDPNYLPAIAALGELRYRHQQWTEAVDLFLKSRTTAPAMLYMLCDAYFHLGNASDARLAAETLAALSRNDRETMLQLVELLNRNNQAALAQTLAANLNP